MSKDKPNQVISLFNKIDSQSLALKRKLQSTPVPQIVENQSIQALEAKHTYTQSSTSHLEEIPRSIEDEQPVQTQPVQTQPVQTQPVQTQPVQTQPVQAKSTTIPSMSTPLPKNNTMQRALEAFFDQQEVPKDTLDQLQLSANSLSLQRQNLIDQIVQAPRNSLEQNQLIKELKAKFGLGADIRILYLALDHDTEGIVLEAFKNMESLAPLLNEQTKLKIKTKIKQIEIRTFQPKVLEAVQRLSQLLK